MGKKNPKFEKGRVICLSLFAKSQYSGCADNIDLLIKVPGLNVSEMGRDTLECKICCP